MVEVCGPETKIEAFIDAARSYGIRNVVRTGTVAMARYSRSQSE
jgi:acetolactate synthase small subunit